MPDRSSSHPSPLSAQRGTSYLPVTEDRARDVLGLSDRDIELPSLPARSEQLWRLDRFAANVPFANPMFVPMGKAADIGLLYQSVATVVHRHEALRTRLMVESGRSIQVAEDWRVTVLEVVDVLRQDLLDDRPGIKSAVNDFTQLPIDLYAQDGFHCRAFRDENGEVTLGFLAHGFFSDAWSSQLLFREVRTAYSALRKGETPALEPARQYSVYAQTQRHSLARNLPAHLSYWHGRLADIPPFRLPHDANERTGQRGRSYFFVRDGIVTRLAAGAQASRISLTLVLLAIYQIALARWSGQNEILSAAYTADRVNPEFRNTIGMLVTNMPVVARLDRGQSFKAFLADFAREFYGGYPHRDLSCELYDAIFSPQGSFCASVFNFIPLQKNFFDSELHSVPVFDDIIVAPPGSRPAIYREIYLGLAQYPNGMLGKIFYNADLFTARGIEGFIEHFRKAAESIALAPDVTIGQLLQRT